MPPITVPLLPITKEVMGSNGIMEVMVVISSNR
jgi:hypothetical protein